MPEPLPADAPHPNRNMIVTLGFDDTFADQMTGAALLEAHGMHGTFYINSPRIGANAAYMTRAQIDALIANGHELGGHTLTHPTLTELDLASVQHEICDDRSALIAAGLKVDTFAYPYGATNSEIESITKQCGYTAARTVGGLHATDSCLNCPPSESIPPRDMFVIATPPSVKSGDTLEDLEAGVEQAENQGGTWLPFVFHHVCDGCSPNAVSPTILGGFLDWLQARGTTVKTMGAVVVP